MQDPKAYLKVKIKSLAEEARIIREEERKTQDPEARAGLVSHRKGTVRQEARHTLLAYGFLRGKKYRQIEPKSHTKPVWPRVVRMLRTYGLEDPGWKIWKRGEFKRTKEELLENFDKWVQE